MTDIVNARFWNAPVTAGVSNFSYTELLAQILSDIPISTSPIVQIQQSILTDLVTCSATIPFDFSLPQQTEGTEFLTLTVTPTDANNYLLADARMTFGTNNTIRGTMALFRDTTAGAIATAMARAQNAYQNNVSLMSPLILAASTNDTTFKLRAGSDLGGAGPLYVNGYSGNHILGLTATLTIYEIKA
jgi:hypothetical protein